MNITNLRENYPKLISHLENSGYNKKRVNRFRREIEYIIHLADLGKITCYADVYHIHKESGCTIAMLREKRCFIGATQAFDLYGKYPDGNPCNPPLFPKSAYYLLNSEYKAIIDFYADNEAKRRTKKSTIASRSSDASVFFLKLQQLGIENLSDATEENILSLFASLDSKNNNSYNTKSKLATVLKKCSSEFPSCKKALAFLPAFKAKRKNIQYLTTDEYNKVKDALSNNASNLTLRNRAIGILALYTGLRVSDIAGLKINAIDLKNETLSIKQQKTGVPLTLPLPTIAGNAIWDYVTLERPKTDCEYIFISETKPYKRIKSSAISHRVAANIMKAADIRQNKGDRKGFHVFRHRLATTLLGNGIARPVISSITGHADPQSLDTYLSTDFVHLKECAISIEQFPVPQEVFKI